MLKNKKILHILMLVFFIASFAFGVKILNSLPAKEKAAVTKAAFNSPNPSTAPTITGTADVQNTATPKVNDNTVNSSIPETEKSNQVISKDVQSSTKNESQVNTAATEPPKAQSEDKPAVASTVQNAVESKASTIVSKPVSTDDFATAASTVLGKLSVSDMMYIFNSARDDFWVVTPVEEIVNIRNILFSKLTDEDLSVLSQLGKKYGRSMTILRKDIDVSKEKDKLIARRSSQTIK